MILHDARRRHPVCPREFLAAATLMPFELKCAYRIVLDLIHISGGRLQDDPLYIAGVLGCSLEKWTRLRVRLIMGGWVEVIDGTIRLPREAES